jgi:lysophospholipase L1-like esterase
MACAVAALTAGCSGIRTVQSESPPSSQDTSAAAEPTGAAPISGGVRYLALGDSLTQGVGAPDESTGARVIVLAQNEWNRSPVGVDYGESVPEQRAAFDDVLIEETSAHGAEFVDMRTLYAEQADQNLWVEDGLHPTPDAYQAWADRLSEEVPAPCKS